MGLCQSYFGQPSWAYYRSIEQGNVAKWNERPYAIPESARVTMRLCQSFFGQPSWGGGRLLGLPAAGGRLLGLPAHAPPPARVAAPPYYRSIEQGNVAKWNERNEHSYGFTCLPSYLLFGVPSKETQLA